MDKLLFIMSKVYYLVVFSINQSFVNYLEHIYPALKSLEAKTIVFKEKKLTVSLYKKALLSQCVKT